MSPSHHITRNAPVRELLRREAGHERHQNSADRAKLRLVRCELADANAFVGIFHRHHQPVVGHKFSLGAVSGKNLVGVAIVGRPVSRMRDDGVTLEVTRLCTDGTRNACSFLYGAAAKAAFALGYERIGTYTLPSEGGASLRACGWKLIGERGGGSWSRDARPRDDKAPTETKLLWETTGPARGAATPELAADARVPVSVLHQPTPSNATQFDGVEAQNPWQRTTRK